jgi:hypothetical protein
MNEDVLTIRQLVENWVLYRDAGDWERFATVWHEEGRMMATWNQGNWKDFIKANKAAWGRVSILHSLGGCTVDVQGNRAVSQTKMIISQRDKVDGVECDVVCTGRFADFWEKREERWGMVLRQPIYEKDRMDPVDPSATLKLDQNLLQQFPAGYRHLAYLQSKIGYPVKKDMPGLLGPEVEKLYADMKNWLSGGPLGR